MEHVTYAGTCNQANSFDVPTSMQTHQQVNNQDGTFDGSITVEIESNSEPRKGQQDDSQLRYNSLDSTSSTHGESSHCGLLSAHQQGPDQGGTNSMRSIDPTPGSSSQTGQTCGSTSSASIASPVCPSLTENTLPGCSSQAESSDVSLLRGKHLQAHFYSNKCRVCLEKGTIPIYGSASGIGEAISLIANVDIGNEKQFPRHLCVKCFSLLQGAMKFRKMAQQTDKILKQSNYVGNKTYLEDDYYLGVNFTHDPGTKLKHEVSMDSYKAEHSESQQAYDFKQAYLMLMSQSTPSGVCNDGYNNESYIKEESGNSSKPHKKFKHSNSDSDSKRNLEEDNDYDDFFDSGPSRKQPQRKAKRDAFKESISIFLKTEIFEESQEDVTDQRASEQGTINLFRCEICDKEFAKVHYKKHLAAHGMIQCKVCKNAYLKINYRKHMREQHKKVLKYVCEICGKELRSKSSHHLHKLTHSNEFPFKCEICPYRGRHSDLLKTHMRSHTKDYKYLCTECPTRCLTSSHLSRHLRTHKEGDFKCATCDKAFHTMGGLTKHQQVDHLGIKNHICNICGKAFGCRKIMMKHQRQVHKRQKLKGGRMPSYLEAEKQQEATESPYN